MKYKMLKDLYDCFCTPPELQTQKQEIDECHQALSKVLGKLERRLVLQIIDAKDRIAEETSIDSFIAGFELAWKLSVELNHYENERSVSCQTAMGSGARFASKEEEKYREISNEILIIDQRLASLEKAYAKGGGISKKEWRSMQDQIAKEDARREGHHKWLKEMANNVLPFIILI